MRIETKDPKLVSLMGEFLRTYLPCVRNRDEDTVASYRYSINLYVSYLETSGKATVLTMQSSDFSQGNIVGFLSWLKSERNNVATTINHRLSDIRGFCRYLCKKKAIDPDKYEEICEINDVSDDRVVDFTWLSVNDVSLILQNAKKSRDAVRDHFLLSLLYESGARINEVLSARLLDIKETSGGEADVHFYGKGKKHRITPLSKEIWSQFSGYRDEYHRNGRPDDLLFYSFRNGRKNKMSSDNVSRILTLCEAKVREGNPDLIHLHSHLFRNPNFNKIQTFYRNSV